MENVGVPESCYTTTEEVVLKIANALNVDISPNDIEISHKLKRNYRVGSGIDFRPVFAFSTKSVYLYLEARINIKWQMN